MNTDIRLHITFWGHHKTKRLKSALGSDGIESLLKLWLWTAQNRPSGVLTSMDTRDIELVSDWNGIEGEFFKTCHDIGWIDDSDGKSRTFEIHDWRVWNPYGAAEDERRSQGRLAKLAQANKEAYQACASAGIRELSADEYQQLKPLHGQALCDCVTSIQSAQSDSSASNSGRRAPAQRRNSAASTPQQRRSSKRVAQVILLKKCKGISLLEFQRIARMVTIRPPEITRKSRLKRPERARISI